MAPYIFMALLVGALALCADLVSKSINRVAAYPAMGGINGATLNEPGKLLNFFDWLILCTLIGFASLRYGVGTDYGMYLGLYTGSNREDLSTTLAESPQEAGYTLLMYVLRGTTDWPYLIFWFAAVLTVFPLYVALKRQSQYFVLAIVLYLLFCFYLAPFNLLRQGIAISLNFLAMNYLPRSKKAFLILNIVAATFHVSVIIAAALQWGLAKKKVKPKWCIGIIAASVIGALAMSQFSIIGDLLNLMNPRYEQYLESGDTAGIGTYLMIALKILILLWVVWIPSGSDDSNYILYAVLGVGFLILGTQSVVVARMEAYFWIYILLLLPNRIAVAPSRTLSTFVAVLLGGIYMTFYLLNYGGLVPYETYLFR